MEQHPNNAECRMATCRHNAIARMECGLDFAGTYMAVCRYGADPGMDGGFYSADRYVADDSYHTRPELEHNTHAPGPGLD
jgi:hypothetical protein